MINTQMLIGFGIHCLIAIVSLFDQKYGFLFYLTAGVVLANLIGMALIKTKQEILGARIFLISSAFLVPIGLIGASGASKAIDQKKREEFTNSMNDSE